MIQIDEQKLRQLFKNRSNCYADAEDVMQAMDEDCFIETVNEALRIHDVVGRSEQLIAFCDWYKTTDFNCEGHSSNDCVDEYLKSN